MTRFTNTNLHGFNRAKQRLDTSFLNDETKIAWVRFFYGINQPAATYFRLTGGYIGNPRPDRSVLISSFVKFDSPGNPGTNYFYSTRPDVLTSTNSEGFGYYITNESNEFSPDAYGLGIGFVRIPYNSSMNIDIRYRKYYNDGINAYPVSDASLKTKFNSLYYFTVPNIFSPATTLDFFDTASVNGVGSFSGNNSDRSTKTMNIRAGSTVGIMSVAIKGSSGSRSCVPNWNNITSITDRYYYRYSNPTAQYPTGSASYNINLIDTDNAYSMSMMVFTTNKDYENIVFSPDWTNSPHQMTIVTQVY